VRVSDLGYEAIHEALVEAVPEFRPVLDEHVQDLEEVLPHLLLGDFTRFVLTQLQDGNDEVVATSLAFLERAAQSSDSQTVNLVGVSFVENVGPWQPEMAEFISGWPPSLQELAGQHGWRLRG